MPSYTTFSRQHPLNIFFFRVSAVSLEHHNVLSILGPLSKQFANSSFKYYTLFARFSLILLIRRRYALSITNEYELSNLSPRLLPGTVCVFSF